MTKETKELINQIKKDLKVNDCVVFKALPNDIIVLDYTKKELQILWDNNIPTWYNIEDIKFCMDCWKNGYTPENFLKCQKIKENFEEVAEKQNKK